MGTLDAAFASLVPSLLKTFSDTPATVTRTTTTFDPATDTNVASSTTGTVYTSPPEGFALQVINGTTIQAGDLKLTAQADWGSLTAPRIGDNFSRGSTSGTIVAISPISSGDQIAAYELQLRTP